MPSMTGTAATVAHANVLPERRSETMAKALSRLPPWGVWPLAAVLLVFFVCPLAVIVAVSFCQYDNFAVIPHFNFGNYIGVLGSGLTYHLYFSMLRFVLITWAISAVVGFFVAYFLVFHVRSKVISIGLFLVCTVPFWTSNIIRTISWLPLLGKQGLINQALIGAGMIRHPLGFLMFSDTAVVISYVHIYTIFMIVPIFNSMSRIDPALFEAARDAGLGRLQTLLRVVLPLTRNGIALGSIFVIALVMGDFYVVKILSGGTRASVVSTISDDISTLLFPQAAAHSVILMIVVLAIVAVILRIVDVRGELVRRR